jgi:hypothetical protein
MPIVSGYVLGILQQCLTHQCGGGILGVFSCAHSREKRWNLRNHRPQAGDRAFENVDELDGRPVRLGAVAAQATEQSKPGLREQDPEDTTGLLRRRPVQSTPARTRLIGKEGNLLEERQAGVARDADDYRNDYGTVGERWEEDVRPTLREIGARRLIRETGFSRSAVYAVLNGAKPHPANRRVYEQLLGPGFGGP